MSTLLKPRIERLWHRVSDRFLAFKPFITPLTINDQTIRFLIATPQAAEWYDPVQRHNQAELAWIGRHVAGRRERIIDAGAYHGIYTLVFAGAAAPGSKIVAVDPVPSNCAIIEANLALNRLEADIEPAAVSETDAPVRFSAGSCGHILASGGTERPGRRLTSIMPDATVAKIDIEGAEFSVLPQQIDHLPEVHTWLVEIHPGPGRQPESLIDLFRSRGFDLRWLNRAAAVVEPLPVGAAWQERTTLIATRA